MKPSISIVLFLKMSQKEASSIIDQILSQSFTNFELLIITQTCQSQCSLFSAPLCDPRIKLFSFQECLSIYAAYNKGITLAKGKYICFTDGNDSYLSERLKTQNDLLQSNKSIAFCGCITQIIDRKGMLLYVSNPPQSHLQLKVLLLMGNCLIISSLLFTTSIIKRKFLKYRLETGKASEYDFIVEASKYCKYKNIPVVLSKRNYLDNDNNTYIENAKQTLFSDLIRLSLLQNFNLNPDKTCCELHLRLMKRSEHLYIDSSISWCNQLLESNKRNKLYNSKYLRALLLDLLKSQATAIKLKEDKETFNRSQIINLLIEKHNYRSYLEIGVNQPQNNFDKINCNEKTGVDPVSLRNDIINSTSDQFFELINNTTAFDLIFIDGLHHCEQVIKDIINSLKHLSPGGIIVCHDMLPESDQMQMVPRSSQVWTGDCWKAWSYLRMTNTNLTMFVVDVDFGVGIIKKGFQEIFLPQLNLTELTYAFFVKNKMKLMNVINTDQFFENFGLHPTC